MSEPSVRVRLILLSGARVGDEVQVERSALLGRMPNCDLCLKEAGVSREHARVRIDGSEVWLEDLKSSNGTKISGRRIQEARLTDGTVFELGKTKVRVRIEGDAATSAASVLDEFDELALDLPAAKPPVAKPPVVEVRKPPSPVAARPSAAPAGVQVERPDQEHRGRGGALQYHRVENRRGLLGDDVSQSGLLSRLLFWGVVLALGALVFWFTYTWL